MRVKTVHESQSLKVATLAQDKIRVQYSGFIIFASQILSIVTGLIFTILLTRNMTEQQYGIWGNIYDVTGYFTIFVGLFPFWATRFAARKREGAIKTAISANATMAIFFAIAYLSIVSFVTSAFNISSTYLIVYAVATLQIVNTYMITILESCLRSVKPQAIGYGLLLQEVIKVALALVLIVGFNQLFLGAMLSLIISAFVQSLFYLRLLSDYLHERVKWSYLKEWLKGSTAIAFGAIGNSIGAFVFILLFLYGGQAARGQYQAAAVIANIILYASSLAFALYPKMLSNDCSENTTSFSFRTVLMFALPMAAIAIAMSRSFLTVLNAAYGDAYPILMLLAVDMLIILVSSFYSQYLLGIERVDEEGKIPLRKLVKSKIFTVFALPYIQAAITLPAAYYILTQLTGRGSVELVSYVIVINILVHLGTFTGLYAAMRRSAKLSVAWRNVAKYILASGVAGAVLYLLPSPTTLVMTFAKVAVGAAVYLGLLLGTDADTRALVTSIWREVRSILSQSGKN